MEHVLDSGLTDSTNDGSEMNQNSISLNASSTNSKPEKLFLSSKINKDFCIEVDSKVIEVCSILKNAIKFTRNKSGKIDPIETEMTQKELEKFVELHQHFGENNPWKKMNSEFVTIFFSEFTDEQFLHFCWGADFLDSEIFLTTAADFLLVKLKNMEIKEFQKYLNISDDYTVDERNAIKKGPLQYFVNLALTDFENQPIHPQNFSFPEPITRAAFNASRISGNAFNASRISGDLFLKLYSTCKYFFAKIKVIPTYFLDSGYLSSQTLQIDSVNLPLEDIKAFRAKFYTFRNFTVGQACPPEIFHQLFEKLVCDHMVSGCINNPNLTLTITEFKILFSNVTYLVFRYVKVIHLDGNRIVTLDELLNYVPNAETLKYSPFSQECYTTKTAQKMADLKRNAKFHAFDIFDLPLHFLNTKDFVFFLKNQVNLNYTPGARIALYFETSVTNELLFNFHSDVLREVNSWTEEENIKKPKLVIYKQSQDHINFPILF